MKRDGERRAALAARLRARREEIEAAILARVDSVSDPPEVVGSQYAEALRGAVGTAVEYGLSTIELGAERAPAVPPELLTQARLSARSGVGLDTVLRRYFAGFAVLGDFLLQEAESGPVLQPAAVQEMLGDLSSLLDRLAVDVAGEHSRVSHESRSSAELRRAGLVKGLLEGESVDALGLSYELECHHLAALARGAGAGEALRRLAAALDARLLLVPRGEEAVWAWLGSQQRLDPERALRQAGECRSGGLTIALGEPGRRLEGWRLSHRQAKAALSVALAGPDRVVRYADVAMLASIAQDELLVASLQQLYLEPLARHRGGSEVLRRTLRAYFNAQRNSTSAASSLGVSRKTVTNRLAVVEERLGRPIASCVAELEAALCLEELEGVPAVERVLPRGR